MRGAPALFESDASLLARILAATPFAGSVAELAQARTARLFAEPRMQFPGMRFATPSGRIEIASARAAADGLPLLPEPHADAPPAVRQLRVLSPASNWLMNCSYGNDATIERRMGAPSIVLHPDDAASRGLVPDGVATLSNAAGSLTLPVAVSALTQPGVAFVHKGRWPGRDAGGATVNVLHQGRKNDIGASTTVHSVEATLSAARLAAE